LSLEREIQSKERESLQRQSGVTVPYVGWVETSDETRRESERERRKTKRRVECGR
jgi:hypothetical protein